MVNTKPSCFLLVNRSAGAVAKQVEVESQPMPCMQSFCYIKRPPYSFGRFKTSCIYQAEGIAKLFPGRQPAGLVYLILCETGIVK
jgi:hypothetical protein